MPSLFSLPALASAWSLSRQVVGMHVRGTPGSVEVQPEGEDLYVWQRGSSSGPSGLVPAGTAMEQAHQALNRDRADLDVGPLVEHRRYVIPDAKLAFCYIPKNACTEFTKMFDAINGLNTSDMWEPFMLSRPSATFGLKESDMTKKNGWTFAYFTRDPLDRYRSAFGSKCMVNSYGDVEGGGSACFGEHFSKPLTVKKAINAFQEHALGDIAKGNLPKNDHWLPQTDVIEGCGLEFDKPDFVGSVSQDLKIVNKQVKHMLKLAGVKDEHKFADYFFPPEAPHGHYSPTGNADFYAKEEVKEGIMKLFEADYEQLHLPKGK